GTNTHQVLALNAADGHTVWSFKAPGAVKASPSFDHGNVFVGDYESSMYALNAKTGKLVWRTNTSKVAPGGTGGFFSSPAIAFGNVYAGRDDGTVYIGSYDGTLFALNALTGKVEWHFDVGGAVPGTAIVIGHTVYVSSFATK